MAEIGTEIVSTLPAEEEASYKAPAEAQTDDMGNCCGGEKNDGDADERSWLLGKGGEPSELPAKYEWEQNFMVNNVMKSGKFTHSVIVSVDNGEVRAAGPPEFRPSKKSIKNILAALTGDTAGVAEEGIALGGGTNVNTPGKLDEGKGIYCTDGKGGGCAIFKTKETVLICVYSEKPAISTRLASELAEFIEDEGGR